MTPLDKFGQFITQRLRDSALDRHRMLQEGKFRAPGLQDLQREIRELSPDSRD